MLDTRVGQAKKEDPADVARVGFDEMLRGAGDVMSASLCSSPRDCTRRRLTIYGPWFWTSTAVLIAVLAFVAAALVS